MIRILIVDDSEVVRLLLKAIFEQQPDMEVVACANNGREAIDMVEKYKPNLVTMDIHMPEMDGLEATRQIMSAHPVPIIIVSSAITGKEAQGSFKGIEAGALWVIEKPPGISHPNFDLVRRELVDTARSMAGMKLVKRKFQTQSAGVTPPVSPATQTPNSTMGAELKHCELVAIGCSTGGPQALQNIFSRLPADFPVPIVVVQHISQGFTEGMVNWLALSSQLTLKVAEDGEVLRSGTIYFAPDDEHLTIKRNNDKLMVSLDLGEPVNRFRPSATPLLQTVARTCARTALGVLLTGMGNDGAQGLLSMRKAGCRTIVQDKESSVVFGMPNAALELEAVDEIVNLDVMADYLVTGVVHSTKNNNVIKL